jgi:hypothetical protein
VPVALHVDLSPAARHEPAHTTQFATLALGQAQDAWAGLFGSIGTIMLRIGGRASGCWLG